MAKYITTAGAFYGFISHGLGQAWGMASGALATFAYVVFEGSLIGGFAYFANDAVNTIVGVNIPWLWFRHRRDPGHRGAVSLSHQPDGGDPERDADVRGGRPARARVLGDLPKAADPTASCSTRRCCR